MAINFKTLLKKDTYWFSAGPDGADVLIASMVRMVRNLPGFPFPGWSNAEERSAVAERILPVLRAYPAFKTCYRAELPELNQEERLLLLERKQITPSMAARQDGCHLLISRDQRLFAMVNEEEHLCVHTCVQGLDVDALREKADDLSRYLENTIIFAQTPREGYLTSMPQEAGEGLQFYVVLHLPALNMTDTLGKVRHAIEKLNLNITSFYPEAEDASSLFVLFTRAIPKNAIDKEAEHFTNICNALAEKELRMRKQQLESGKSDPVDCIYRAFGLMSYAMSMEFKELLGAISLVRLGLHYRILFSPEAAKAQVPADVFRLYSLSPALLRYHGAGEVTSPTAAKCLRSCKVRETMGKLTPILLL